MRIQCGRCHAVISAQTLPELFDRIEYHVQENCWRRVPYVSLWQRIVNWIRRVNV